MIQMRLPDAQGLYNPENEHDNCGIGFVAHIKGKPSHDIVLRGLDVLLNMDHRGATGADKTSGDGAGLLMQIPHEFITDVLKLDVGEKGTYGTGIIFLPKDEKEAATCIEIVNKYVREEGLTLVGYRDVPVDSSVPGEIAKTTEPTVKQIFIRANLEKDALERKL